MASALPTSAPGLGALDLLSLNGSTLKPKANSAVRARAAAQDFEAVFLNAMFQHMFTDVDGDGPFGGQGATGVWRSLLTDQYAKSIAKAGGIGIADQVYRSLITLQEKHA